MDTLHLMNTFVPDVHLITSSELTFSFDFWSLGPSTLYGCDASSHQIRCTYLSSQSLEILEFPEIQYGSHRRRGFLQ